MLDMTFIAPLGMTAGSLLLGFILGGLREGTHEGEEKSSSSGGSTLWMMLIVTVSTAMMLWDRPVLSPPWLQYGLLLVAPLVLGYVVRRVIAIRMSKDNASDETQ